MSLGGAGESSTGSRLAIVAALGVGAAAALALRWALPPAAVDPARSTVAILPLVVASAWSIERWLRDRGLDSLSRRERSGLVAALAALVVAALRAPALGLAAAGSLVAVGLALVLGYWVVRTLVRLRPLLGERLSPKPPAAFFWLPFLVYASLVPWTTAQRPPDGDEPYNLLIAHSLWFDHDADLSNNYRNHSARRFLARELEPQLGDPHGPSGQVYSRHNLLLPLVLALPYGVGGSAGALVTMAALTALLAYLTLRLAHWYFPERPGEVMAAWSVFAFLPPLLLYSSQLWVEVPAALLVVYGLDRIHATARNQRRAIAGVAAAILLLPLIKIRLTLLAASLLAIFLWRALAPALRRGDAGAGRGSTRSEVRARLLAASALTAALALLAAAILIHNQIRFGNPLKVHSVAELDLTTHPVERYLRGLCGLFLDGAFGLFAAAPVWLAVVPALGYLGARALGRSGRDTGARRLLVEAALLAGPYLVFVAPRGEWYGGWSPPFRYGLAFLPLLGIALSQAMVDRARPLPRLLLGGLGAATMVLTLLWVTAPGWTYNFANGTSRVLDHLDAQLGVDLARLAPSYVRTRAAAVWGPLACILFALLWRAPTPGWRGAVGSGVLGAGLLPLAASGILGLAARLPTRVVEVEDAWVTKSGGDLHPPMWTIDRWRYQGSWLLPEGERLVVPVVPGGARLSIEIEARYVRRRHPALTLEVRSGEQRLAAHDFVEDSDWSTVTLGPVPWPADGGPLVVAATGPDLPEHEPQRNRLVLDRLRIHWQ